MLPNPLIAQAYLARGAQIWLGSRAVQCAVFLVAGMNPIQLSSATSVAIILWSVAMSFLDTRRRRERALLANLGVRPMLLGALFAGPAIVGEIALGVGGAAFR
jgi:hypothetical protein